MGKKIIIKKRYKPAIIVHGGAWNIPDEILLAYLQGVEKAVKAGYEALQDGESALDSVEKAVIVMEDDPIFDAGIGSFINEAGFVELDALIMDGDTLRAGAIGAVTNCRNPISLARRLLEDNSTMMLVGKGADLFAEKMNLNCNPDEMIVPREMERWKIGKNDIFGTNEKGTVGAVAIDSNGKLASATSTGGSPFKMVGRLGDSSLIGSGGYASKIAAASSTGHGESFMKIVAAKFVTDLIENGYNPSDAAKTVITKIANINGYGGIIVINFKGEIGYFFNTKRMAYALITTNGKFSSGINK